MPERRTDLLIADMLAAVRKIERFTSGMDQDHFRHDEKTVDAVVRNLEVLGEAARRLPEDYAARHPDVPWRQIAGLRNRPRLRLSPVAALPACRIVHDYFGLDLEIIWQVIRHDLPQLQPKLESLG